MATIVVVKKNGYAVLGAETMTKLSSSYESAEYIENHSKIIEVGDNYIGTVGHPSFGLVLSSYFARRKMRVALDSPQAIFDMACAMHRSLTEEFFLNPVEDSDDPFESSQFSCLIANDSGIYGLYSLRSVQAYSKFYAFGTGSEYAMGAMHAVYNLDYSAEEIARIGIEAACQFDDGSGLPLEIKSIKLKDQLTLVADSLPH